MPLRGRAPLPHRRSPTGAFSLVVSVALVSRILLEKGEPPLKQGMSLASRSPVKREELALAWAISAEYLLRKIEIHGPSHEKRLITWSHAVLALSAQGILHASLHGAQVFSSVL